MTLQDGHFVSAKIQVTNKKTGKPVSVEVLPFSFFATSEPRTLPLVTWIDVGEMKANFSGNYIEPKRVISEG